MEYLHTVLYMFLYTTFLVVVTELFRRFKLASFIAFLLFLGFSMYFSFYLYGLSKFWFIKVKTPILALPVIMYSIACIVYEKRKDKEARDIEKAISWILVGFLQSNILVAVFADYIKGTYLNAAAGLILCVLLVLFRKKTWYFDTDSPYIDFKAPLPMYWISLYTSWNLAIVLSSHPQYFLHVFCALTTPLVFILTCGNAALWLMTRAYALAVSMTIRLGYDFISPLLQLPKCDYSLILNVWGGVNLALGIVYLLSTLATAKEQPSS